MERWSGRVALVTGASKGIGAAICRALVKHGMVVIGCARHLDDLQNLEKELVGEKGKLNPMKCDLTVIEEVESMFQAIKDKFGGVDVCINNAGTTTDTPLLTGNRQDIKTILDLNLLAVMDVTQLSVKSMRERNVDGHVINIGSISCRQVKEGSMLHVTTCSKFGLLAYTEGLRHELRTENTRIRSTLISPSLTDTPLARGVADESRFSPDTSLKSEDVADALVYALAAPSNVNVREIILGAVCCPM